jgi:hypothetical protein
MTPNYPTFNAALMHIALRAAVDGSSLVRRALVSCIAKYAHLHGTDAEQNRPLEYFLANPLEPRDGPPPTAQALRLLRRDPCPGVRSAAAAIGGADSWDGRAIHRLAHISLFTGECAPDRPPRYSAPLFGLSEPELFELIRFDGEISAIAFFNGNVAVGTAAGEVFWGASRWVLDGAPVTALCHVDRLVATTRAAVYVLAPGDERPVECFSPGVREDRAVTAICAVPGGTRVCIAQGGLQLLLFDCATLMLIGAIDLPAAPLAICAAGGAMFCLMDGGRIARFAPERGALAVVLGGMRAVASGAHGAALWSVDSGGAVSLWEGGVVTGWGNAPSGAEVLLHPRVPVAIARTGSAVSVVGREGPAVPLQALPVRCACWEASGPLCALGHAEGIASVWRIPV